MTPGIGNSIALLAAGALTVVWQRESSERNRVNQAAEDRWDFRWFPSFSSFGILLIAWLLLMAFYVTAWLPKQRIQTVMAEAEKRGGIDEPLAIAMLQGDPWSPQGYRWLTQVRHFELENSVATSGSLDPAGLRRYEEAADAFAASDRASAETWVQLGNWELALGASRRESLSSALQHYREASRLAPGEIGLLVQTALAAWLAGETNLQRDYLKRAEAIENEIDHEDRKLSRAHLYWPSSVGPPSTVVAPSLWQAARDTNNLPLHYVWAEPVFRFLRSRMPP